MRAPLAGASAADRGFVDLIRCVGHLGTIRNRAYVMGHVVGGTRSTQHEVGMRVTPLGVRLDKR